MTENYFTQYINGVKVEYNEWDYKFKNNSIDLYFEKELKKTKTIENEEERTFKKKLYQKLLLVFKHSNYLSDCIEYGECGSSVLKGIYNRNLAVKDAMRLMEDAVKKEYWTNKQYTDCRNKFIDETKYFNETCDIDDFI